MLCIAKEQFLTWWCRDWRQEKELKEEILSGLLMEDYVQTVRIADTRTVDLAKGDVFKAGSQT